MLQILNDSDFIFDLTKVYEIVVYKELFLIPVQYPSLPICMFEYIWWLFFILCLMIVKSFFFSHFGYKLICDWFMFSRDLSWNQITRPIPSNKVADNMTTLYVNNTTFIYLFILYLWIGCMVRESHK